MREVLRKKIIQVCNKKIESKGKGVGLSFYAFFVNRNDDPELLMEAATWWIMTNKLDHFEKAEKIKMMIEKKVGSGSDSNKSYRRFGVKCDQDLVKTI